MFKTRKVAGATPTERNSLYIAWKIIKIRLEIWNVSHTNLSSVKFGTFSEVGEWKKQVCHFVMLLNCFQPYFVNFCAKNIVKLIVLTGSEYLCYNFQIIYYHIDIVAFTLHTPSLSLLVKLLFIEFKAINVNSVTWKFGTYKTKVQGSHLQWSKTDAKWLSYHCVTTVTVLWRNCSDL